MEAFLVVTVIKEWHIWPLVSEGNNAKCPLKYRTVPHSKVVISQMLMVSWLRNTERRGKIKGVALYPVSIFGWQGWWRGRFALSL